jgi:hypothetical protein
VVGGVACVLVAFLRRLAPRCPISTQVPSGRRTRRRLCLGDAGASIASIAALERPAQDAGAIGGRFIGHWRGRFVGHRQRPRRRGRQTRGTRLVSERGEAINKCRRKVLVCSLGEGGKPTNSGKTVMATDDLHPTKHKRIGLHLCRPAFAQSQPNTISPGHPNQPTQPNKGLFACWNQA